MLSYSIDFVMSTLPKLLARFFSARRSGHYLLVILLFMLISMMSCASSKKGTLNCGSKYRLYSPPFNK